MIVKTSELEGAALDWAVAQIDQMCAGLEWARMEDSSVWAGYGAIEGKRTPCTYLRKTANIRQQARLLREHDIHEYDPSEQWQWGGPLVEKLVTELNSKESCHEHFYAGTTEEPWYAVAGRCYGVGRTPLVAAMRAIVAAEIGVQVDVPAALAEARGE